MEDLKKLNPEYFEQLSLGLEMVEEEDGPPKYTLEEKNRRSMAARETLEKLIGEKGLPVWYETYQELVNSKWPWRVACYVAWASSPKRDRWPKTQAELATEVLGLTSDRAIHNWRQKSPDIDAAISLLQSAPMLEHRADVFAALVESASNPDHRSNPDRKLFYEMTGDYTPRQRLDVNAAVTDDALSGLSEAELVEIARRAKKKQEKAE